MNIEGEEIKYLMKCERKSRFWRMFEKRKITLIDNKKLFGNSFLISFVDECSKNHQKKVLSLS